MAPRKLRTPPYCAWYCFVSLILAIVGAGLYKRDFAGGKTPEQTFRNESLSMTDDVSNAGRRLRAAFTTTTTPVDPDSVQVDDEAALRRAPRHGNSQDGQGRGLPRDAHGRVPLAPAQGRDGRVAGVRLGRLPPRGIVRAERGRLGDLPAVRLLLVGVVVVAPAG